MSMYDAIFGVHPWAGAILHHVLDLTFEQVPRLRDVYPVRYPEEDLKFEMVTRAGGANSEEYADELAKLEQHPLCIGWRDWTTDHTYRIFWFSVPHPDDNSEMRAMLEAVEARPETVFTETLAQRFEKAMQALRG